MGQGIGSVSEDEYRRRALECVALCQFAENSEYRVLLLGMAQACAACRLRRDVRRHRRGYRYADRDRSGSRGRSGRPRIGTA